MPYVKYLAAQVVLMMEAIHAKDLQWVDCLQANIIIMSDLSMRAIDIGCRCRQTVDWDIFMLAGLLSDLMVSTQEFRRPANRANVTRLHVTSSES